MLLLSVPEEWTSTTAICENYFFLLVAVFEIVHIVWDRSVKERDKYPVWVFLDEVQVLRVLALEGVGRSVQSSVCVCVRMYLAGSDEPWCHHEGVLLPGCGENCHFSEELVRNG